METVLKRKDKTSIVCSSSLHKRRHGEIKGKITTVIVASCLMLIGMWMIHLTL